MEINYIKGSPAIIVKIASQLIKNKLISIYLNSCSNLELVLYSYSQNDRPELTKKFQD